MSEASIYIMQCALEGYFRHPLLLRWLGLICYAIDSLVAARGATFKEADTRDISLVIGRCT